MKKPAKNRRTVKSKGRSKVPSTHYYVPSKNLSDAARSKACRERREEELPAIVEPRRIDLEEQARMRREIEARGHRYPGFDVLLRLDRAGKPMTEEQFEELFQATEKAAYYFTGADAEAARLRGFGLPGEDYHKRRPGLLWETVSAFPADDRTFKRALSEGVLKADELRAFLAAVTRELPAKMEAATRYRGTRGVEVFATLIHFEQGGLHLHPYFSDVDLVTHERAGYFRPKGNKGTALVMATASPGMVAAHRYRREGLPPQPVFLEQKVTKSGLFPSKVVEDWGRYEKAIETRRERLGYELSSDVLPWDLVLTDWFDGRVRGFCRSNPELAKIYDEEWSAERALVIGRVRDERARLAGREAMVMSEDLVVRAAQTMLEAKRAEAAVAGREAAVDLADRELACKEVKLDQAEAIVAQKLSEAQRAQREAAEVERRAAEIRAEAEAQRKGAETRMAEAEAQMKEAQASLAASRLIDQRVRAAEKKVAIEVRRAAVFDGILRAEHMRALRAANEAFAREVARSSGSSLSYLLYQVWPRERLRKLLHAVEAVVACSKKPIPDDLWPCFEPQDGHSRMTQFRLNSRTRSELAMLAGLAKQDASADILAEVESIVEIAKNFDRVMPSKETLQLLVEAIGLWINTRPMTQAHYDVLHDAELRATIVAYATPRIAGWRGNPKVGLPNLYLRAADALSAYDATEQTRRSHVLGDEEFDRE